MAIKHVAIRTCVVCRQRFPKRDMLRHVRTEGAGNGCEEDLAQIKPGRGVYICSDSACRRIFSEGRGKRKRKEGKEGKEV